MNPLRIFLLAALVFVVFGIDRAEANQEKFPNWSYEAGDTPIGIAFSAEGDIVLGSYDNKVYFFDKGNSTPLWNYTAGDNINAVDISANGQYLVAASRDNYLYFFERDSNTPLWSYTNGEYFADAAISLDGQYITASDWDGRLYLFSKDSSTPLWIFQSGGIMRVDISSDGEYIVAASNDNYFYLFNKDSNESLWNYTDGHQAWAIVISSDGEYIAAASDPQGADANLYFFNRANNTPLWNTTIGDLWPKLSISQYGNYLATSAHYGPVSLFNKNSNEPLWQYSFNESGGRAVSISADGQYVAACLEEDSSSRLLFWHRDSNTPLWSSNTTDDEYVLSTKISDDGRYVGIGTQGEDYGGFYLFDNGESGDEEITRGLNLTVIDTVKEIYLEYEGSDTRNSVKFKVKLENTGSHNDTYIPEVVSTLENGWSVSFWQDSSKTQSWPASGVDIEAGELDDLWVFVGVDDEADEGNYTIQFSVYDEDENPDARKEGDVTVTIIRPELTISPDNIRLEIDGVFGNSSQAKDGDVVVVYVDVQNIGNADADDVKVEIYYYPKKTPTTQQEIDELLIAGFEFDEDVNNYIYMLYSKNLNIGSNSEKTIVSDDWLIKSGEWYVEARVDFYEDNDNGAILESNENNNDARYPGLLRIKSDLVIDTMRVDSKYGGENADTPEVDDIVTFTVTITNRGAADVSGSRLYITADSSTDNEILKDRNNLEYIEFDVDASETTDVRFRWKATLDNWSNFRAEINPICEDYNIVASDCDNEGDGFASETGRMFDELGRYADNEFPRSGVFEQDGAEVKFELLSGPYNEPTAISYSVNFAEGLVYVDVSPEASSQGCNEMVVSNEGQATIDVDVALNGGGVTISPGHVSVTLAPGGKITESICALALINSPEKIVQVSALAEGRETNTQLTPVHVTSNFTVEIFNSANTADDTTSKEEDYEGDEAGECSDEADNDKDGLFDCDDDTCAGSPACKATDIVEAVPEEGLSSLSIVPALISIGLLAIFRRK